MPDHNLVLKAISFASRAHRNQLRKDNATPYAAHVCRVAMIASQVFGIQDPETLATAALHDTIEDTPTDYDDLHEAFGENVAYWVSLLTKDMRLPESAREVAYEEALASAPWQVYICKLADIFDNLSDSENLPPAGRERAKRRANAYLNALHHSIPPEAERAYKLTRELLMGI
ncbi:MAG: HD domain-containing protein [Fimbriiglobus sp.]